MRLSGRRFCSALREIPEWTCPILSIWKSKWRKKAVWLASACWVGFFSEGIDLKEDSLIGALIVGTGLPQVCTEREIIRGYFEENGENGFDYAYRYPGMNKVLQAAGRVIRTADDVGIVALLDDRFLTPGYRRLFPREWEQFEVVRGESIGSRVEKFWNDWL